MTNVRIAQQTDRVVVGVDTNAEVHVAAALDSLGRLLGRLEVGTHTRGYAQLLRWARTLNNAPTFAVEGTGAYGAGLARYLATAGCVVIEINRPDRRARRRHGKSDPIDAEAAARSVLTGGSHLTSKRRAVSRSGPGSPSARTTKSAISTDGRLGSDAKRDFRRLRRVANFRREVPTSRHVYRPQGFGPTRSASRRSQIGRTIRNECRSLAACNRQQRRRRQPP